MTSANGNRQHRTSSAPSDSKRAARGKCKRQFITFIICVFLVGGIAGGLIVGGVQALGGNDAKEQPPYGTRDGKSVTENGELMLIQDAAGFTPLDCELSEELQEFTYYMCRAYYIDFDFTMSLMFSESSFNAAAVSQDGHDFGLMQIRDCNNDWLKEELGVTDMLNPYENIRAGLYILRGLFEKYNDSSKVVMAYKMGEYGASVLWDKGVYETTASQRVLAQADKFAAERNGSNEQQNNTFNSPQIQRADFNRKKDTRNTKKRPSARSLGRRSKRHRIFI